MCDAMKGPFLFGKEPTVADFYLFVMLVWAERFNVEVPQQMVDLKRQMLERPAVRAALQAEAPVRTEI